MYSTKNGDLGCMVNDPYSVLGLPMTADEMTIRERYRQLAKLFHPDLHPDNPAAAQKMNELNEAYEQMRSASFLPPRSASPNGGAATADAHAGAYGQTAHGGPSAEELWEDLFRSGAETQNRYQRPRTHLKARTVLLRAFLILLVCNLFIGLFTGGFKLLFSGRLDVGEAFNPHAGNYHGLPFSGYQTVPTVEDQQSG